MRSLFFVRRASARGGAGNAKNPDIKEKNSLNKGLTKEYTSV